MLRIIKSINEENLSKLISEFLLKADYDDDDDNNNSTTATTSSNDEMKLYLRDIIISKLNSLSEEVVTSCLVLFNELISSHGKFALPLLIEKLPKCVLEKSTGDVESDIKRLEVHRHRLVHTFSTDIQHHDSIMDRYLQILPSDFEGVGERSLDAYLQEANRFAENYQRVFKRGRSAFIEFMPRSSSLSNESFDVLASSPSLPSGFPYGHDGSPYTTAIVPPMLPNGDFDGDGEEAVVVEVGAQGDDALGATVPLKKASVMNTMEINSNNKIHSLKQDMIQLGRDTTLRKFISKFSTYFSHTYEINLALTGVISQLASAPQPALYLYMFCADTMLDSEDQEDEENGEQQRQSLFTVLERLGKELSDRRAQISDYNRQLNIVRGKLFASTSSSNFIKGISAAATSTTAGLSSLAERRNKRQSIFTNLADLDLDTEFLKNVVLLEETMKEFVAILLLHSSREYARTDYI